MKGWTNQLEAASSVADFLQQAYYYCLQWEAQAAEIPAWLQENLDFEGGSAEIQEICAILHVQRAKKLAEWLIDDSGRMSDIRLQEALQQLEKRAYCLGNARHLEAPRQEHIKRVLYLLLHTPALKRKLLRFTAPYSNRLADNIVRETLGLEENEAVTDASVRRAVLSAWLTFLRQNVGSCFATAPAILVQSKQPNQFLDDLHDLLTVGRLTRTFQGVQYVAPLSTSWGMGELKSPIDLQDFSKFAASLSLKMALEAAELPLLDLSREKQLQYIEKRLKKVYQTLEKKRTWTTSPEEILRLLLLRENRLTAEQYDDYLAEKELGQKWNSPFNPIQRLTSNKKERRKRCEIFEKTFSQATMVFKSLTDNALLKSWEFSLASFAETKADFCQWNLYSSLGLHPEEKNGIGESLNQIIRQRLDEYNAQVEEYQNQYEPLFAQQKYVEGKMRKAASDRDIQFLKAEHYSLTAEIDGLIEKRDQAYRLASTYAELTPYLIKVYQTKFREYFQEIYDPSVHEVDSGPYDDSPAGFRLVYKHGRENAALWTPIGNPTEYIDCLTKFFLATEVEIGGLEEMKGLGNDFSYLVSAVVSHIKRPEFLESAFQRMADAHGEKCIKDPLNHLNEVKKKPWVYLSGGRMDALVSCYYMQEELPTERKREVENEMDLFVFLLDFMKDVDGKISEKYAKDPSYPMLMTSPTHAFSFRPGMEPFVSGWRENRTRNTYTWIRDEVVIARRNQLHMTMLSHQEQIELINMLLNDLPAPWKPLLQRALTFRTERNSFDFRSHLIDIVETESNSSPHLSALIADRIDALLYRSLPFTSSREVGENVKQIIRHLPGLGELTGQIPLALEKTLSLVPLSPFIPSFLLQQIVNSVVLLAVGSSRTSIDYHLEVKRAMEGLQLTLPKPFIFADTNWMRDFFAFVVNPGNGQVEMWRVDYAGCNAHPMTQWKHYFKPDRKNTWNLYVNPAQYNL